MIENYLGFPQGVSGSELATRASAQAERFGAEVLLARPVVDIASEGSDYTVRLRDGSVLRSQAVLVATGVEWRRIEIDGLDRLLGAGVYYGAGPSEAVTCRGCRVVVIGGGNSAGQAVVRFARHASSVTLIVRGSSLEASMSHYLSQRVSALNNVEIRTNAQIVEVEGDAHLRALVVASTDGSNSARLETDALFVCIGGVPRTDGLSKVGFATDAAGYLLTGPDLDPGKADQLDSWPLPRSPLPLETNLPGLFAAGDVRSGSIKRCAAAIGEGSMAVALVHRRLAERGADR
jgi:thioredoxin reductase (NADPH)